jgi:hypothetical protein
MNMLTGASLIERMREFGADNTAIRIAQLAMGCAPRTCVKCGTEFLVGPGTRKPGWTRWCSTVCKNGPRDYRTEWEKATGIPLDGGPTLENALWREGIQSMEHLAKLSAVDMLRIPNVGRRSLLHIANALMHHGHYDAGSALRTSA